MNMKLPTRQIHLDFHTSPYIPDVGKDFCPEAFASTMKEAHVNSATVFAKCHHGMSYFPTVHGVRHPHLGDRDLLGEQIEALHRQGIRAPIYTTVVWEERVAHDHPEWRQMTADGRFAEDGVGPDGKFGHKGMWKFNDFMNPEYQDYFEAHLNEIHQLYGKEVDGFFIDILFFHPRGGWSDACRSFRTKHGLLNNTPHDHAVFQGLAQKAFAKRFTPLIHGHKKNATIFYNAQNDMDMHPQVGPRARAEAMTHLEIESLPSGFWGYYHFPRMARAQRHWGKPWLGMTGRFQKMWGDFGGIKPQPALEYECFRSQALGGCNSVGDQLPPRGILDPAAYKLIGSVFQQCEEAEPFYEGAKPLDPQLGIFSASYAGADGGNSETGAILLCEDLHCDFAILDAWDELDAFKLLILPDTTVISTKVAKKLEKFYKAGGQLILSGKSGFDAEGNWALPFLPLKFKGQGERYPSYWRAKKSFDSELSVSDRVVYSQGMNVVKGKGLKVLIDRVLPYFNRTDLTFSSHFQTPPQEKADTHPAVIAGERFIYFADPVFAEYRQSGNPVVQEVWRKIMEQMCDITSYGKGLASSIAVYPMRRNSSLLLTLLHYIPVRKAIDIDVIDERGSFAGERLFLKDFQGPVFNYSTGEALERDQEGGVLLPPGKGRLLLEVPDFFSTQS